MSFNKALVLFLFFCSISSAYSQSLVVKNVKNGKERHFPIGSTLLYMASDSSELTKGKILALTDSTVSFYLLEEEEPIEKVERFSNITVIRKPSKFHYFAYAAGTILMINGAYFLLEGPDLTESGAVNRGLGVISFALGLIPFITQPATYEIGDTYIIEPRDITTKEIKEVESDE